MLKLVPIYCGFIGVGNIRDARAFYCNHQAVMAIIDLADIANAEYVPQDPYTVMRVLRCIDAICPFNNLASGMQRGYQYAPDNVNIYDIALKILYDNDDIANDIRRVFWPSCTNFERGK